MPYIDCNKLTHIQAKQYDFTIIGAGVLGILLGIKLSAQGYRVQLIESGHFVEDDARQVLNAVEHSAKQVNSAEWGRKRAVGGTSIAWGGQSLPFTPIDFEHRAWVANSGWPIPFEEVERFYAEANAFMGVDQEGYSDIMLKKLGLEDPGAARFGLTYHVSKWANEPNFVKLHGRVLEQKIDVFYNAQLLNTTRNQEDSNLVVSIRIANFQGQEFVLPVKTLIVAAGGIETVRILLLNRLSSSPWLGQGFMEHPCMEVGEVAPQNMYDFQRRFNTHVYENRKYSLRLSLSDQQQRALNLLNCSASFLFRPQEDTFDPYAELRSFLLDFKITRIFKISQSLPELTKGLLALLGKGFFYKPKTVAKLALMIEQEPLQSSTISLGDREDQFGQKLARINWEISRLTWDTAVATCHAVKDLVENLGLGKVSLYAHVDAAAPNFEDYLSGVNHHMGGARISENAGDGVVDTNLGLWDVRNVYVCSCAIFPTGSHSNPTLTLMALGCRLVDYLIQKTVINN